MLNKNVFDAVEPVSISELHSYHNLIVVNINNFNTNEIKSKRTTYIDTNWHNYRNYLNRNLKIDKKINTIDELDSAVNNLTNILLSAKHKFSKTTNVNLYKENLPTHVQNLIKQRNSVRKKWQHQQNPNDKNKMTTLTNEIKTKISEHLNKTWNDTLAKLKPEDNSLWKITRKLKKSFQPIPVLIVSSNTTKLAISNKEKAEEIATNFEQYHYLADNTPEQQKICNKVHLFLTKNKPNKKHLSHS